MADLRFVGNVAGNAGATVRATVIYEDDWRDERGFLPPPAFLFTSVDGGAWKDLAGQEAYLLGSADPSWPAPKVTITYTTQFPNLPPLARSVTRHVFANTQAAGLFDWTLPDQIAPAWSGGGGVAPSVTVQPGQGPRGADGSDFLSGAGQPASQTGQSGDKYLDEVSFDIWKKVGSDWQVIGNIKGATGAKGGEGPKGVDGKSFPTPKQAQLNFIPIADGTQPYGFSWRSITQLGLKNKLAEMQDVSVNGLTDGQVLAWNASASKFVPVNMGGGTSGNGASTGSAYPDSGGLVYVANGVANGMIPTMQGGFIAETLHCRTPYYMRSDWMPGMAYRVVLPSYQGSPTNFLAVVASFEFSLYNLTTGGYMFHANNSYAGYPNGARYWADNLPAGEYAIVPFGPFAGGVITVFFNEGWRGGNLASRIYDIELPNIGFGYYLNQSYTLSTSSNAIKNGAIVFTAKASETLSINIVRWDDYTMTSHTVIQTIEVPPDNTYRAYQSITLPDTWFYGVQYVSGQGEIWHVEDIMPGYGELDRFSASLHPSKVSQVADVYPQGLGVLDDGMNPPKLVYKRRDGTAFEIVMTAIP